MQETGMQETWMVNWRIANARDMNSIPGLGGSHMPQGNWAHDALGPGSHNYWAPQLESSPYSPQLENAQAATKTQHSQIH